MNEETRVSRAFNLSLTSRGFDDCGLLRLALAAYVQELDIFRLIQLSQGIDRLHLSLYQIIVSYIGVT